MRIDRELDKVFRVTITETEAEEICDQSRMTFERAKQIGTQISCSLLNFIQDACVNPHAVKPALEVEL